MAVPKAESKAASLAVWKAVLLVVMLVLRFFYKYFVVDYYNTNHPNFHYYSKLLHNLYLPDFHHLLTKN